MPKSDWKLSPFSKKFESETMRLIAPSWEMDWDNILILILLSYLKIKP